MKTQHGLGDFEETVPLGSWRKGGGLAGSGGHVYIHGPSTVGVWLTGRRSFARAVSIAGKMTGFTVMQQGDCETAFRVDARHLPELLTGLKAKRRRILSPKQVESLARARRLSPIAREQDAFGAPGSTQAAPECFHAVGSVP